MDLLIDQYLPVYHFQERHATIVKAGAADVRTAVMTCNLGQSPLVRILFRLRGLPTVNLTLTGLETVGFRILGQQPERELVLGLVGRFWTYSGGVLYFDPKQFAALKRPELAKAAINFRWDVLSGGLTRLSTETRIWCPSRASRRRFKAYWALIRPFSGLVRVEWLRLIRCQAEAGIPRRTPSKP